MENAPLVQEWLSARRGGRVAIRLPQRGAKRKLVDMVAENARQGLVQRRVKWLSESDKVLQALAELHEALSLPALPTRIECYDVSNIQGTNSVGSMVVFEDGRPRTAHYRRFKINSVEGPDDYSSMQEMLRRRFKRLGEQLTARAFTASQQQEPRQEDRTPELGTARVKAKRRRRYARTGDMAPDEAATGERMPAQESWGLTPGLVLIDGGKGHLSAVQQVFLELGIVDIPLASIAKQHEEIFLPHQPEPVLLPRTSQALYLVQRVRDEAHRFAITYHRQRRSKASTRSALDSVQGVGPKRRRTLLRQFGSVERIRQAPVEEIAGVPGMTLVLAQRVKDQLGGALEPG